MKLEILKENLKASLSITERVVGKNLSLPILDNVFLNAEDSFLGLFSTNLETTIRLWVLAKIIEKGKAVIPVRFLSAFISSLPNEKIIIEGVGHDLVIECKNYKTRVQGYNPEEFPIIPEFTSQDYLEVNSGILCAGLSGVTDVASPSLGRPEISGIYFNFLNNNIKIAATDSFRLAEKNIAIEKPVKKEYSFILPQKPAREIMAILENKDGVVKIYFSSNQVLFELPFKEIDRPQVQIISRLIDGEYPNYQEIIPSKFKTHIEIKKDEFLSQVKTASLFSNKTNEVKISANVEKKEVGVFAKNPDTGESKSSAPAKIEGETIEISFNFKYLIDGLTNIKSSEVVFDISKEDGPCVLRPVGDASYIYVVMPIKSI